MIYTIENRYRLILCCKAIGLKVTTGRTLIDYYRSIGYRWSYLCRNNTHAKREVFLNNELQLIFQINIG